MSSSVASVLVEPFDAYLARRARSAVALAPGEAVTVAVALLRGCPRTPGGSTGTRWMLRADGCPVAIEEGQTQDAVAATADMLDRAATITHDGETRDMLERARESVLTRPPREWEAVERRLFQHADPVPLVLGPLTPVDREPTVPFEPVPSGSRTGVLALVDSELAEAVGEILRDLRDRWRTSRALRLGVIMAASALVVVAAALMWPHGQDTAASAPGPPPASDIGSATLSNAPETSAASGETARPASERSHDPRPPADDPSAPPDGPASDAPPGDAVDSSSDDAVAAARAVFDEIERCAGDVVCTDALAEESTDPHDPLLPGAANAGIDLVDDFGGVAVVRVTAGARSQYVTLVRQTDRWLVRAVRTIADQPS